MKVESLEILRCDAGWRNYHFLKLTTDDGIIGWSEFDDGFGSPGVSAVIERLAGRVIGQQVFDHERIYTELYCLTRSQRRRGGLERSRTRFSTPRPKPQNTLICAARRQDPRSHPSLLVALRNLADQLSAGHHHSRRRQGYRRRSPQEGLYSAEDQHLYI